MYIYIILTYIPIYNNALLHIDYQIYTKAFIIYSEVTVPKYKNCSNPLFIVLRISSKVPVRKAFR